MRIAIIADIHEDIINLQLAFSRIEQRSCDRIVCLGDISGFNVLNHDFFTSRNATSCLEMLIKHHCYIIAGNHDLHAAKRIPENSTFEYPNDWHKLDFAAKKTISQGQVWLYDNEELNALYTQKDIDFLKRIPEYRILSIENERVLFSHYLYPNLTGAEKEFYLDENDCLKHQGFLQGKMAHFSFAGHMHPNGLIIINKSGILKKTFRRKYEIHYGDTVIVPPVVRTFGKSGFCVFDTKEKTVEAIKI